MKSQKVKDVQEKTSKLLKAGKVDTEPITKAAGQGTGEIWRSRSSIKN